MVGCPDDAAVLAFSRGELDPASLAELDGHLDTCDDCRQLVAALATGASGPDLDVVPLAAGTKLGRYEVSSMIGRGTTGRVYRARDTELGRDVAIKVLVEGPAEQLFVEARTMAKFQHPNIVAVHDVGREGGQVFLAMEHVAGGSLRSWIEARPPAREVLAMFAAIADGLHAAHEAGLSHGDFKPDNVVVDEKGRPRVADFGLARFAEGDTLSQDVGATRTVAPAGTPAYMAPEQWGGGVADARSDQFSFFVALAEALGSRRPFAGSDMQSIRANVLAGRAVLESSLPVGLEPLILRGLATEPGQRHADMAAVAGLLRKRPSQTWKTALGFGAAVGLVGLVGFLLIGEEPSVATAEPGLARLPDVSVRATSPVESPVVAEQLSLAQIRLDEGDYNKAQDAVHAALAAGPYAFNQARAWLLQAAVMGERGDYQGARRALDVATSAAEKAPRRAELDDDLLHARGLVDLGLGKAEDARASFAAALERARSEAGTPEREIRALVHLGLADKSMGDLEAALASHRQALAIETTLHGEDDLLASRHHHNIGGVLRSMKRFDEALEHYLHALNARSAALGDSHPTTLMTVNSLGLIDLDQGRLSAARRAFERADAGLSAAGDLRRARALTNLGIVAQRRRRLTQAKQYYEDARRLWVEAGGEAHPLALELDEALKSLQRKAKTRPQLAPDRSRSHAEVQTEPSYGASPAWSEK